MKFFEEVYSVELGLVLGYIYHDHSNCPNATYYQIGWGHPLANVSDVSLMVSSRLINEESVNPTMSLCPHHISLTYSTCIYDLGKN